MKNKTLFTFLLFVMSWNLIGCALGIDPSLTENSRLQALGLDAHFNAEGTNVDPRSRSVNPQSAILGTGTPISGTNQLPEHYFEDHSEFFTKVEQITVTNRRLKTEILDLESPTYEEVEKIEALIERVDSAREEVSEIIETLGDSDSDQLFEVYLTQVSEKLKDVRTYWNSVADKYESTLSHVVNNVGAAAMGVGIVTAATPFGWIAAGAGALLQFIGSWL